MLDFLSELWAEKVIPFAVGIFWILVVVGFIGLLGYSVLYVIKHVWSML